MAPTKRNNKRKGDEAGPSSGGLSEARKQMRLDELADENADLRAQLAALQAPTAVLKYEDASRADFLKKANQAKGMQMLDLSDLRRHSNSFIGNWYPKWKPDAKLDGTVNALIAATNEVQGLDLGEGSWAAEDKYSQDLATLLRKYGKTLTSLRVAMSTLVERHETVKSLNQKGRQSRHAKITYSKLNLLSIIGGMTKLTSLKLIVNPAGGSDHCEVVDDGLRNPKLFKKLKSLELFLTDEWARDHVGEADSDEEEEDSDAEQQAPKPKRWRRPVHPDTRLSAVLACRGDAVTHLDMVPVRKTKAEPAFVAQVAALRKLRSIALRAEMLPVTRNIASLEAVELHLDSSLTQAAADAMVEVFSSAPALKKLQKLEVLVRPVRVPEKARPLLGAVAQHCDRLGWLKVVGSGWGEDELSALLRGASAGSLRELHLDECGSLEATHLPLIADLDKLATLRLPSRLLGKPGAEDLQEKPGLDLRWQH